MESGLNVRWKLNGNCGLRGISHVCYLPNRFMKLIVGMHSGPDLENVTI